MEFEGEGIANSSKKVIPKKVTPKKAIPKKAVAAALRRATPYK